MDDIFIILIDSALIYCWYCCYCSAWWYICNDYSVIIIGCCYVVVDDVFDVDVDVNDTVLFEDSQCQVMSCWWIVLYFGTVGGLYLSVYRYDDGSFDILYYGCYGTVWSIYVRLELAFL